MVSGIYPCQYLLEDSNNCMKNRQNSKILVSLSILILWDIYLSRFNFWGYSTVNFFSPMGRYSSAGLSNCGLGAINEFKYLVKEAHKRGIEVTLTGENCEFVLQILVYSLLIVHWQVIMDVVFNHTAEGNENGPILSFRGIDNSVFYTLAPKVCLSLTHAHFSFLTLKIKSRV